MSYEQHQQSRAKARPISLYLFIYGPTAADYYAYTDYHVTMQREVTVNGSTFTADFEPLAITRGNARSSGTLDKTTMDVSVPRQSDIAELFRAFPPSYTVNTFIIQGHLPDDPADFKVTWVGRVLSATREDSTTVLSCEPIASAMRRPIFAWHYQRGCPRALYLPGCNADRNAATRNVTGSMTGQSPSWIGLAPGWEGAFPKEGFRGGIFEYTADDGRFEVRTILGIADRPFMGANTIRLSAPPRPGTFPNNHPCKVILGCGRNHADCINLHNNEPNYGGCLWIPTKNPFKNTNNFY